jgi:hypothetical protein
MKVSFGLARTVRDNRAEPVAVRQQNRIQRLGQRADLVEFNQDAVAAAVLDTAR